MGLAGLVRDLRESMLVVATAGVGVHILLWMVREMAVWWHLGVDFRMVVLNALVVPLCWLEAHRGMRLPLLAISGSSVAGCPASFIAL